MGCLRPSRWRLAPRAICTANWTILIQPVSYGTWSPICELRKTPKGAAVEASVAAADAFTQVCDPAATRAARSKYVGNIAFNRAFYGLSAMPAEQTATLLRGGVPLT